ncbi:consensus disorder prediction [Desulfoluna spongiiphila]|nr:consensus disorder prediction [Desulfoluna spongiiphila]
MRIFLAPRLCLGTKGTLYRVLPIANGIQHGRSPSANAQGEERAQEHLRSWGSGDLSPGRRRRFLNLFLQTEESIWKAQDFPMIRTI